MLVSNEVAQEKNSDRGKEFNSVVWDVDELPCPISWLWQVLFELALECHLYIFCIEIIQNYTPPIKKFPE